MRIHFENLEFYIGIKYIHAITICGMTEYDPKCPFDDGSNAK